MDRIYMDNAATTPVRQEVIQAMLPYLGEVYGNASSVHAFGREAKKAMEEAREKIAHAIGAKAEEIYFTSGGTEADNWALKGVADALRKKGKHIITSTVEHHAVLHVCETLAKSGFDVTYVGVDENGRVNPEDVRSALREDTILVSIMMANNEIGTIQPIEEIGAICREKGVYLHTDAVQVVGHIPIDVEKMHIDLLSLSGHKLNAPKGIGALYIRKGVRLSRFMEGGAHERGRRAGTENVAAIVALGAAIEIMLGHMEKEAVRLSAMRDRLMDGLLEKIPFVRVNGDREYRLPGNANVSIQYIEGESLLLMLDMQGIAASSGSACTSGSLDPSHVLLAIGLPHEIAHGSLRFTLGYQNTMEEIEKVIEALPKIVDRLREMSPLFLQLEGGKSLV